MVKELIMLNISYIVKNVDMRKNVRHKLNFLLDLLLEGNFVDLNDS